VAPVGALTSAELAAALGRREAYGHLSAFLNGWTELLDILPVAIDDRPVQDELRVLLRESARHAMEGLGAALDSEVWPRRVWVEGEVGWRSSRELTSEMAKEDEAAGKPYRWFSSDDLRWLVRLGYADVRIVRGVHVYRLTQAGAALQPLGWSPPWAAI
jgi:hypothetical protein